jgi:hypothetical protein
VPSFPDPFVQGDLAADAWERLDPLLESAFAPVPGLLDREDPPALHGVRIRVKRLRYAVEVLEGAFAAPPQEELRGLKALQTALGEHHDTATLEAFLKERYEGLAARGRRVLASGTLELLAYVGEARLLEFRSFCEAARALPAEALRASLRRGLGLGAGEAAP